MDDCMSFPPTWQDFVAQYQFRDSEEVYTNGSKLIPVFRIEQMIEHYHEHIKEENERLVIKLNAEHIARQNAEIENDKLRELVLCLLTCASNIDDTCDKCPVNGGAGIWELEDFCDSLLDRMRELRIEAKE